MPKEPYKRALCTEKRPTDMRAMMMPEYGNSDRMEIQRMVTNFHLTRENGY